MAEDDRLTQIRARLDALNQPGAYDRYDAGQALHAHAEDDIDYLLDRLAQAQTELGEMALVLEQQDRTLAQTMAAARVLAKLAIFERAQEHNGWTLAEYCGWRYPMGISEDDRLVLDALEAWLREANRKEFTERD